MTEKPCGFRSACSETPLFDQPYQEPNVK